MSTKLTTRDFFRSPRKVAELVKSGRRITVTRASKPFFEVLPTKRPKGLTVADFKDLVFSDKKMDRDASKRVDEIVYGDL
ncbi:hypothetical protein A3H16_04070 [Candidatus Kaiserbacteria bacterium RIFCSPLOWO2_12_FULL_53_8]|uniref:Prevent-host-death protein n=2 Tax=Candidatus Kaiseribacteriota TaxID=1752734 RepID=A0A1F6CTI1_9BACT|nr:MAG: hypothetical protein A2851_05555 [Candidatus Kaiserbacteria bacterium RIFCSPHIGHO2_01_FULL_53_29]OGG92395.1 MAG: hypothetical protein A3H16_04070 [Candidatus Kaiserbacteria bacterium RIFCSPLOWO2_12_FULL_53_8]